MVRCFIFTGEKSADHHGKALLQALKKEIPSLQISGVFGKEIRSFGLHPFIPMEEFQVMGFSAVLKALPRLRRHFNAIVKEILTSSPELVLLIDYPGFNLRLAKTLRKKGFMGKIVHYISPSVWAWKEARIHTMAKVLDLLLCILPFEPKYYAGSGLNTVYVGNPTLEAINGHSYHSDWKTALGIKEKKPILALFPGSREEEVKRNLPIQLEAAKLLKRDFPDLTICVSRAPSEFHRVPEEFTFELMRDAALSFAKCGTVVLELALLQTPTVVTYQMSKLNYYLAKYLYHLDKLPFYSLPNIILQKEMFPELIYPNFTAKNTYEKGKELLTSPKNRACLKNCLFVKEALATGRPCSEIAAESIAYLFA